MDKMKQKSTMGMKQESQFSENNSKHGPIIGESPDPRCFEDFIPWACKQFNASRYVNIHKIQILDVKKLKGMKTSATLLATVSSLRTDSKPKPLAVRLNEGSQEMDQPYDPQDIPVLIEATYTDDTLIQLKFNKCYHIPCQMYLILIKIIEFYPSLTTLIINSGLDAAGVVYVGKLLLCSSITEVILDGSCVPEANYHILLEKPGGLYYLSLARCRIDDDILQRICSTLEMNGTASKALSVLNLSSNEITDVGASYIGYCLRTNRKLKYLNLSNNKITDHGAKQIFDSLTSFELNEKETQEHNSRLFPEMMTLCKDMQLVMKELKANTFEFSKYNKTVNTNRSLLTRTRVSRRNLKSRTSLTRSSEDFTGLFKRAIDVFRSFHYGEPAADPNYPEITRMENGKFAAAGNNVLCSLSLAYNKLTYFSLIYILDVLCYQSKSFVNPGGLIRLQLDGNNLPKICHELMEIDRLLNNKLENAGRFTDGNWSTKRRRSKTNITKK